jgi:hypothetical protein
MSLDLLLCGQPASPGLAQAAMGQLSNSIRSFSTKAVTFLDGEFSEESRAFAPFCTRVLLENGCAALLGRLDCFRILYLSEFQAQPDYKVGERMKSSFSWTGDVIPDKQPGSLWNADSEMLKISRALFSSHVDHIFWKPAVNEMIDFVSTRGSIPETVELLNADAETFINEIRGRSTQLYSTLSKGVHWEFFSTVLILGEATVKTAIRDTCLLLATLGLVSHFIPTSFARVPPAQALDAYIAFRRDVP